MDIHGYVFRDGAGNMVDVFYLINVSSQTVNSSNG
jgi:hypothetical protein